MSLAGKASLATDGDVVDLWPLQQVGGRSFRKQPQLDDASWLQATHPVREVAPAILSDLLVSLGISMRPATHRIHIGDPFNVYIKMETVVVDERASGRFQLVVHEIQAIQICHLPKRIHLGRIGLRRWGLSFTRVLA